jgi:HK97 family phage portal protein
MSLPIKAESAWRRWWGGLWLALKGRMPPFSGYGGWGGQDQIGPYFSSASLTAWARGWFRGSQIDYAEAVGDLSASSLVMAAVNWLGTTLPEAPLVVYRDDGDGQPDPVRGHPLPLLFSSAMSFPRGHSLWRGLLASRLIDGNAYLFKVRNAQDRVIGLRYLPHQLVRPRWPADGSQWISYYDYWVDGQPVRLDTRDVIHHRYGVDPGNERLGLSPLKAALREIFADNEIANFTAQVMHNLGIFPFIVSPRGSGIEVDTTRIKDEIMRRTTGDQRYQPLVLTEAIDIHRISFNPSELNLMDLRILSEERVAALTGIPAIVLQLEAGARHSTYSNTEQAIKLAWKGCVLPTQKELAEDFTAYLLPEFTTDPSLSVGFDLSGIEALAESRDARFRRADMGFNGGFLTLNEARIEVGLQPDDTSGNGDLYVWEITGGATRRAPLPPEGPPGESLDQTEAARAGPDNTLPRDQLLDLDQAAAVKRAQAPGARVGRNFDPNRHPRDPHGRFRETPDQEKPRAASRPRRTGPPPPSTKAARARAAYKSANRDEQQFAEANEVRVARALRARALPDNEPADIVLPRQGTAGGLHGIELKTLVKQSNDKITVKREARERKRAWQGDNNLFHTVAYDARDVYAQGQFRQFYSGHTLYYKRGSGAFRLGSMYKVKDYAELRRLLETPDDQLPKAARGGL